MKGQESQAALSGKRHVLSLLSGHGLQCIRRLLLAWVHVVAARHVTQTTQTQTQLQSMSVLNTLSVQQEPVFEDTCL